MLSKLFSGNRKKIIPMIKSMIRLSFSVCQKELYHCNQGKKPPILIVALIVFSLFGLKRVC